MTEASSSIHDWMGSALAGSLVSQIAKRRGIELEDMPHKQATAEIQQLCLELDALGIDPELTAEHMALSLACLFTRTSNVEAVVDSFTGVLWHILGDPDHNGDKPPEIYRKAGFAIHLALVGFFDPSLSERVFDK